MRALLLPTVAFAYLCVWPPSPWLAVAWALLPFLATFPGDKDVAREAPASASGGRRWPATFTLCALFALQGCTLALALVRITSHGLLSAQSVGALVLLSVSSVVAGAVTGHELIHSKRPLEVAMGRLLLATLLYEHFHTEHLHGHHVRYATAEDPATARYGEPYWSYLRRTVPGQWRSAWRLEALRLQEQGLPGWRHRVLQGMALEVALCVGAFAVGGMLALSVVLLQAGVVQVVFSAVQYFQHWGLVRSPGEDAPHSWDGDDRVSFLNLLGLSRHADHHAHPSRAFDGVHFNERAPRLPYPYSVMVWLAVVRNHRFQELMRAELDRCGPPRARARAS